MTAAPKALVAPRELRDHLLSHGHPIASLSEVAELTGLSPKAAADALVRLRRSGQMFSPHRGLYVAVPPQFKTWGVVPATDFIDAMMRALGRDYYVALLSAAELHGAAHQRPQVFQVMVDQPVSNRDFERVRLRFYSRSRLSRVPTQLRNTATGQLQVSTPAATALDLASRPTDAGGLSNVATVVSELVSDAGLDADAVLSATASDAFATASLRRLGWLLEFVNAPVDTDALAEALVVHDRSRSRRSVLLDPTGPRRGRTNPRWGVVENSVVEPDL